MVATPDLERSEAIGRPHLLKASKRENRACGSAKYIETIVLVDVVRQCPGKTLGFDSEVPAIPKPGQVRPHIDETAQPFEGANRRYRRGPVGDRVSHGCQRSVRGSRGSLIAGRDPEIRQKERHSWHTRVEIQTARLDSPRETSIQFESNPTRIVDAANGQRIQPVANGVCGGQHASGIDWLSTRSACRRTRRLGRARQRRQRCVDEPDLPLAIVLVHPVHEAPHRGQS